MARVKLNLPEKIIASFIIPVRITDLNYGNHVGNHAMVEIIHEARIQFLQQHNYTELNIEGVGLIMADLAIEFKNEAFYGDEFLIQISVADISKVSFEMFYHISTQRNNKTILIAKAKTGMVCFNYENKKVAVIPGKFKRILQAD